EEYADRNPDVLAAVHKTIARANDFIGKQPAEAARILSTAEQGKITAAKYQSYLTFKGIEFTTAPHGLVRGGAFMTHIGLITNAPANWRDLVFDTVKNESGS